MRIQTLKYQRDLYRLLLQEISRDPSERQDDLVSEVLDLVIKITRASLGYIEVRSPNHSLLWSALHQRTRTDDAERSIERTQIDETFRTGRLSARALLRPDSEGRHNQKGIRGLVCAPIASRRDFKAIIYLHGDETFDTDLGIDLVDEAVFTSRMSLLLRDRINHHLAKNGADPKQHGAAFSGIIGHSQALRSVIKEALMVSDLDVNLLITGDTGTGKSAIVKAIHRSSPRRFGPFVHINCAVLPESLVESELFGAMRGAHSSAYTDIPGKISAAAGGTLFLDEIGELPLTVQAKFLQFLEEGVYCPLGAQTPVRADTRIVAASNANFDAMIQDGEFRADLFFRLNVYSIHMPPLSERREDIPALVKHFTEKQANALGILPPKLKTETTLALMARTFPGNVRQLQNMCQRAIISAYKSHASELGLDFFPSSDVILKEGVNSSEPERPTCNFHKERVRWEKAFLFDSLKSNNWNISKTAQSIGLSRSHMNNLVKHYSLRKGRDM